MNKENVGAAASQQYLLAKHWASDLAFFKLETVFLRGLLENHFIELCDSRYLTELKRLGKQLMDLHKDEYDCEQLLNLQLIRLSLVAKFNSLEGTKGLIASQVEIEGIVMVISEEYREVKRKVFKLLEVLMREHKVKN